MASTVFSSSSSDSYLDALEQVKHQFWTSNANLSEEQRLDLWSRTASITPSMAQQVPRSMPSTSGPAQLQMSDRGSMDRTRSAPALSRSMSTTAFDNSMQRSATTFSDWQSMPQDTVNSYTLYSDNSMRSRQCLPIAEVSPLTNDSMVEYSPVEYINNCMEPHSSAYPPSFPQHPQQLHVPQLTPNLQWSSSSDGSASPSTSASALMTPITQSSDMSRQSSCNPHFFDNVSMLRAASDSSCMLPILSEDGVLSFPYDVESKPISSHVDGANFLTFTGLPSEAFFSPVSQSVSASAHALASSQHEQSDLVEDMLRSASTFSNESNVSDTSASSTYSRQSRREREINAQAASRKIAPKAIESNDETESAPSNAQMARIRSEDGSSKTVGLLTKTPYVRPQHPKIMCKHCNERPDGFRGTHELDRHVARAHAPRRKGYICVDNSPNKTFLANCKHCRNEKVYGAYYNAAAHLRRAHFHPRKRGRKGKNDEKRGGIGGGDDPPMEHLKQHWIKETDIPNDKPLPKSPESALEDAREPVDTSFDATYEIDDCASYPQQQMPLSMNTQAPIDVDQYMGYESSMHAGEPMVMYDNTAFAPYDANGFQFDAYMNQSGM
ncbi:hypothetical protein BKA66DRAFT_406789 [Pyrenochaeta sp. MPI-SDFR-AT-0127]|nr:hypothetical protein BKA66DRAFT_406789 [Pyrenochaeta sp. MPI-SDFR-AT-0127]